MSFERLYPDNHEKNTFEHINTGCYDEDGKPIYECVDINDEKNISFLEVYEGEDYQDNIEIIYYDPDKIAINGITSFDPELWSIVSRAADKSGFNAEIVPKYMEKDYLESKKPLSTLSEALERDRGLKRKYGDKYRDLIIPVTVVQIDNPEDKQPSFNVEKESTNTPEEEFKKESTWEEIGYLRR